MYFIDIQQNDLMGLSDILNVTISIGHYRFLLVPLWHHAF